MCSDDLTRLNLTVVSVPGGGESGIGDYTNELITELSKITTETINLPLDSNNPFKFARCALRAGQTDADVIHIQHEYGLFGVGSVMSWVFFPLLYFMAALHDISVVVTYHEALNKNLVTQPLKRLKQQYIMLLNMCITFNSEHVVFLSETSAEKLTSSVEMNSYSVLSHGVNLSKETELTKDEAKRNFGYDSTDVVISEPGYIEPRKGNDIILKLAKQLPKFEFLIAGGPPNEDYTEYAEQIQEQAPANVQITGRLPPNRFHQSFVASDLIVLPYRNTKQKGIVNSLNQSGIFNRCATYSTPTITSRLDHFCAIEQQWDCIITCKFNNTKTSSHLIEDTISSESRRAELSTKIREYAQENSFKKVGRQHTDIYRSVVGSK